MRRKNDNRSPGPILAWLCMVSSLTLHGSLKDITLDLFHIFVLPFDTNIPHFRGKAISKFALDVH